jgi:signal transduction histidine kinase
VKTIQAEENRNHLQFHTSARTGRAIEHIFKITTPLITIILTFKLQTLWAATAGFITRESHLFSAILTMTRYHCVIINMDRILKQHVVRLELANEEMETFSFSVSHDLKAPLRHMRGFMELLQKRMEGQLDEKSRHYAVLISDAAKKMEHLINDLLSLARLGRLELQKREVDISNLVKEIVD